LTVKRGSVSVHLAFYKTAMQQSYVIGIDIGTGSTKAVAVNEMNEVLCTAQRFYPSIAEGEKSEQDVCAVFRAFQQSIKDIVDRLHKPPAAVSLSSAMHSLLAVDKQGRPLNKAMLWSDTRSRMVAEALRNTPEGEAIYLATGTPLHSMSPLCKIKWLQESNPLLFSKAAKFISIKEFIWAEVFGEYSIDHSLASATGLFNIHQLCWEEASLRFAGIGNQRLSLPVPATHTRQLENAPAAEAMGLPTGIPFLIGASDGTLANLGSLCLQSSEAAITIGTSAAVRVTSATPVQNWERMIFNYRLDEQTFVCGGAVNNGGNVFNWLLQNLFAGHGAIAGHEQLFALMGSVVPGSNGLLFLPYLHGERAPIWDEKSSGAFVGLTSAHNLAHFARAAGEGLCFALYHILASLEEVCGRIERLFVSGGLVGSGVMMQMLADVTGKKVVVQQAEDASAIGAVYLAQKTRGIISDYSSLAAKEEAVYEPQRQAAERYQNLFVLYRQVYPALKQSMHSLHPFSS
jgi:gluconokinase